MFFPCLETGIQGSWIPGNAVSFSIYLVLFLLYSAVQLLAAGWEKDRLRKISKPFCVFVLFFAALMTFPTRWALYLGLLCGMIGDIFLIFTDNKTCVGLGIFILLMRTYLFDYRSLFFVWKWDWITAWHRFRCDCCSALCWRDSYGAQSLCFKRNDVIWRLPLCGSVSHGPCFPNRWGGVMAFVFHLWDRWGIVLLGVGWNPDFYHV